MRVFSVGGEGTVWVSGNRRTKGLEVGNGKKGPPKRVALTSARRGRRDVKARVVPAGPIKERETATVETPDKRDALGEVPTRKLKLPRNSSAGDKIKGVGHVDLKHSPVGMEIKGRPKRMNHCLSTDRGGHAEQVGDKWKAVHSLMHIAQLTRRYKTPSMVIGRAPPAGLARASRRDEPSRRRIGRGTPPAATCWASSESKPCRPPGAAGWNTSRRCSNKRPLGPPAESRGEQRSPAAKEASSRANTPSGTKSGTNKGRPSVADG